MDVSLDTLNNLNILNDFNSLTNQTAIQGIGSTNDVLLSISNGVHDLSKLRSSAESWMLLGTSLVASILGSGMIFFDLVWNFITGCHYSILASNTFLGVSLSLSCGTLLMACFNAVLTKALSYIQKGRPESSERFANLMIIPLFLCGVITCLALNWVVLRVASHSVLACPHHGPKPCSDPESQQHYHDHSGDGPNDQTCPSDSDNDGDDTLTTPRTAWVSPDGARTDAGDQSTASTTSSDHLVRDHMGHIAPTKRPTGRSEMNHLLVVGIQTTVGIVIHRVPEGLLLFSASKTDKELGLSLVLALSVHSFSEGFAIATPLYGALQNRFLVMLISAFLGCFPPLLGGFIGYLLFNGKSELSPQATYHFGLYMAGTAGFMLVVCIQMISAALRYMPQNKVLWGVVSGVILTFAGRSIS